ncbi:hypothetical protein D5R93_12045 [Actinomyces lilanjuaniae]|uniref:Uncharacterized protein n=1 Tax=Actinomyces lilanjuaniae TaxID=2321394 RepID=A0ABN5PR93_9ACTO|nr:hypothetical protein D5R93_12045 [Actinomyces lilanjuaniae]
MTARHSPPSRPRQTPTPRLRRAARPLRPVPRRLLALPRPRSLSRTSRRPRPLRSRCTAARTRLSRRGLTRCPVPGTRRRQRWTWAPPTARAPRRPLPTRTGCLRRGLLTRR